MNAQKVGAIILAAGVGKRLKNWDLPKSLLSFSGLSLLERHIRELRKLGVNDIHIVGGYRIDALADELRRLDDPAQLVLNEDYKRGSALALATNSLLRSGKRVILMDADVLFAPGILKALVHSRYANSLLVDMHPVDDEAVKLCFVGDAIVDFAKRPQQSYERCGESVGFFHFSSSMATALADRCNHYIAQGMLDVEYETPLRDLLVEQPTMFGAEDITGMPWIEIDFDADIERAHREILPRLEALA